MEREMRGLRTLTCTRVEAGKSRGLAAVFRGRGRTGAVWSGMHEDYMRSSLDQ